MIIDIMNIKLVIYYDICFNYNDNYCFFKAKFMNMSFFFSSLV